MFTLLWNGTSEITANSYKSPSNIPVKPCKEVLPIYGKMFFSLKAVYNCVEKYLQGRSKFFDEDRSSFPALFAVKIKWATGERIDLGWSNTDNWEYCNNSRMFSWFRIRHYPWSFEFPKNLLKLCPAVTNRGTQKVLNGHLLADLLEHATEDNNMLNKTITGNESWDQDNQVFSETCISTD